MACPPAHSTGTEMDADRPGLGRLLSGAWRLGAPFFTTAPNRARVTATLAATLLLNLCTVGLGLVLSYWRNSWYTALQAHDWPRFIRLLFTFDHMQAGVMPGFVTLATLTVGLSVQVVWLRQWLQIEWRSWLTEHLSAAWRRSGTMQDRSGDEGRLDNPDQRIADDIRYFTEGVLVLGLDLVSATASAIGYVVVLWRLSGTVDLVGVAVPGSMVVVAFVYAAIGSWLTHLVGRRLSVLDARQQRREADFRFALMRERSGADLAKPLALGNFAPVAANFRAVIKLGRIIRLLTRSYNQVADIFPLIVAAPRYFSDSITLGTLLQIGDSFGQVQQATSWFVNNYADLADLRATVIRLDEFASRLSL